MIGRDGQPMTREQSRATIAIYNSGVRGSKDFGALPRALVTILDNLAIGKTGYLKGLDGQLQISRRKDQTIAAA